jgi:CBS domain-containing protein
MTLSNECFTSIRAKDVMTRDVVTVYANQQLSTAAEKLLEHQIQGAPVVSYDETCVGVLSSRDVIKRKADDRQDDQVFSHMSSPAITVSQDHSLAKVGSIMYGNRIHRVPVVDDRGQVVGILSAMDIVGHVLRAMEPEPAKQETLAAIS